MDFANHVITLITIAMNKYFGGEYALGYAIILLIFLAAVVLISIFLCSRDSKYSRSVVPWAFLLAGISSLLLAFWVVIYITSIYDEKYVKIPRRGGGNGYDDEGEADPDEEPERVHHKRDYYRQSKSSYVLWNTIFTFINGGLYLCLFWLSKVWVDANAEREEAQDI